MLYIYFMYESAGLRSRSDFLDVYTRVDYLMGKIGQFAVEENANLGGAVAAG